MKLRKVTDIGGGDPGVQALTRPASEDLDGFGDMAGQCIQVRAALLHLLELEFLVLVEGVGVAQHPAGDVAGLRRSGYRKRVKAGGLTAGDLMMRVIT